MAKHRTGKLVSTLMPRCFVFLYYLLMVPLPRSCYFGCLFRPGVIIVDTVVQIVTNMRKYVCSWYCVSLWRWWRVNTPTISANGFITTRAMSTSATWDEGLVCVLTIITVKYPVLIVGVTLVPTPCAPHMLHSSDRHFRCLKRMFSMTCRNSGHPRSVQKRT